MAGMQKKICGNNKQNDFMITKDFGKTVVAWQEWGEDQPGEPAIVLTKYNDCVEICQNDSTINISNHEIEAFIKILRKLQKL